ncbi:Dyp-type peroxidase [Saccharomonospora xinjiangensis]|uniref:Dyp-type peroxidase n=1 Tax=Saccharomonospora xinjiangensis TaxID=75294 RepID=UPI001FFC2FCA|nr:Dyp-type peroxidase [Saccharomonospora xinjiangensis]
MRDGMEKGKRMSVGKKKGEVPRRAFVNSVLVTAGAATAAGALAGYGLAEPAAGAERAKEIVPFYGKHQAGIATRQQRNATFLAADLASRDVATLRRLLDELTLTAAALTRGDPPPERDSGVKGTSSLTDFGTGLPPARLTVTVGLGPAVFAIPELAARRPRHLTPLPIFDGDALNPWWCGGDVLIQICADDPQIVSHAVRSLRARMPGLATLRWTQYGFLSTPPDGGTPRNMFGHKDGTANPKPGTPAFDDIVWARSPEEPEWFAGGTYLVFRKIRMKTAEWDLTPLDEQDRVIGRRRSDGAPLGASAEFDPADLTARAPDGKLVIPADAHIRRASGMPMLRRGYTYDYGIVGGESHEHGEGTGEHGHGDGHKNHSRLDAGLLFCCYVRDPEKQFVETQRMLAEKDRLNDFIEHTGSAIVAVPPGAREGQSLAEGLLRGLG